MATKTTTISKEQLAKLRAKITAKPLPDKGIEELPEEAPTTASKDSCYDTDIPKEWRVDTDRPAPIAKTHYKCIQFDDPVAFSLYFDPQLAGGYAKLYDWQAFSLYLLVAPEFSISYPLEYNLVASNGSGKDAYFIAKAAAFLLTCKIRARVVITTKDFTQLTMQTFSYISAFCETINKRLLEDGFTDKKEFIKIRQGHITCEDTGSEIVLFVTDESKRAEGYHPWNDHPDSELTIICNEAKSINDPIFQALRRCTGYKRFICVSSTGNRSGYFYREVQRSIKYPEPVQLGKPYARFVTSYECAHVSPAVIARDKESLERWLFESIHESKFSSVDGSYIMPEEIIMPIFVSCRGVSHTHKDKYFLALDLSLGSDETVLLFGQGNKLVDAFDWRIRDNTLLEPIIEREVRKLVIRWNLNRNNTTFNADAGGPGAPILNHIRRKIPLQINYIYNNHKAVNRRLYGTASAEDYFHIRQLITKRMLIAWDKWPKIMYQLCLRQFEYRSSKIYLEDKADLKTRGEDSPDWADTLVLLWRRYRFSELQTVVPAKDEVITVPQPEIDKEDFDWEEFSRRKMREVEKQNTPNNQHKQAVHNLLHSHYGANRRNKIFHG